MATINYRLANTLNELYKTNRFSDYPNFRQAGLNWSDNNILNRFIRCDLGVPEFEVPVIIIDYAKRFLMKSNNEYITDIMGKELVVPLIKQNHVNTRRTADSILRTFFESDISDGILSIETNKGIKYHGGRGCIFDSNFNSIFLATVVGHYNAGEDGIIQGYTWTEYRVYLHPSVFIEDSLIGKAILKKVIPYLLSSEDIFPRRPNRLSSVSTSSNIKVKIIVEDTCRFFKTPTPMGSNFSDDILNDILVANIEDVISQIRI